MSAHMHPQPLEYSNRPVVGAITCDRREGAVTLTAFRDHSRLVRGAALAVGGLVLLVAALALLRWRSGGGSGLSYELVFVGFGAVSLLVSAGRDVITAMHPAVVEFDGRRLVVTRRGLVEVHRGEWEAQWVIDVRTTRLAFQDTLTRPFALLAVLTNNVHVELLRGTRAEVDFAGAELRAVMGLPPERWLEAGYPPQPRWAPISRVISVDRVAMVIRPPRVPLLTLVFALPVIVAGSAWFAEAWLAGDQRVRWTNGIWQTGWAVVQVAVITLFGVLALCGAVYRLRPWTTLAVDGGWIVWSETGLRPGYAEWPLAEVSGLDVMERSRRRADLRLVRPDGSALPILRRRPRAIVDWVKASLEHAMANQAKPRLEEDDATSAEVRQ